MHSGKERRQKKAASSASAAQLRRRAEARLQERQRAQRSEAGGIKSAADTQRLVHELEVHQTELEMQNDELSQGTARAESSADKFSDLYDFAPAGYLTLDRKGTIRQANLSAATCSALSAPGS
jgi:hypothetical protein